MEARVMRSRGVKRRTNGHAALGIGLVAALGFGTGSLFAAADDAEVVAQARPQQAVEVPFNAGLGRWPWLHLFGADVGEMSSVDAEGMRFTIPLKRDHVQAVGVESPLRLCGDFEITVAYELLSVPRPGPRNGAGVRLAARWGSPTVGATVTRLEKTVGPVFGANLINRTADGQELFKGLLNVVAEEPKGRLRLLRSGSGLSYQVADGGETFETIARREVGKEEVTHWRVECGAGETPAPLDVRLVSLSLRADQIPNKDGAPELPAEKPPLMPARQGRSGSLTALVFAPLSLGVALLLAVGVWLGVRRRRAATAAAGAGDDAAPRAFACPACAKSLKGRPEQSGKRLRCPGCGGVVRVPGGESGESAADAS
jgi:hypothetical protein